ncbi:MAG TPA: universal stress protein [Bryobacteraceae bacterium]
MKINHILFPVDFSDHSRALNPEVERLAKHFGAKVTLLHVFEVPAAWYGSAEAPLFNAECFKQLQDDVRQRLLNYQIDVPADRVERIIAEGAAAGHINNWAAEHNVDLIVMGTHGYGTFQRLLLGSVAMKVLHEVSCPVWTVSPTAGKTRDAISNVVCALELGDETVPLLRFTKQVAAEFGAAVRIVHSVPQTEARPYTYFDVDLHRDLMKMAREEIAKLQQEAGTNFPTSITEGAIGKDIANVTFDQHADLLIVGRGKAQATFGGLRTHAYDIIRQAPCPVLSYSMDWEKRSDSFLKEEKVGEPATA